ncbi:pyridoxamine 5'-phosphate oxidase family protein [Paraoerskovia marina]|uniref:Pyridoxamine 5'-phosphate oxidase n=1 Tax=Paraoerskovia marina TaxID=545619 RepID=A0A1H1VVW4_9CELL|nr:pyridoxamine 5'-phosphate oxidase family protein [Paraoerskovia marina]SDS88570.1 Pyridoxamine 5'-phosphate oxidase [Paraoerskovia marina]
MTHESAPVRGTVENLSTSEATALLGASPVGRLGVAIAGEVDIFPVNHVLDDGDVLFTTAPGSKLAELTVSTRVVFEVDGWDDDVAWSVVARGTARVLDHESDVLHAESLGLESWSSTRKSAWVRVSPDAVSGRRIYRTGTDPEAW